MTYKEVIARECERFAQNEKARFIGYNTVFGSRMYGTLAGVDVGQCVETPVAENLMMGLAMGMSLEGYRPVVCFERHDFMLLALDAIVNHLDKMPWLSGNQFTFPVIVRAIVGATEPLHPGPQHTQDYTEALTKMLKWTRVVRPESVRGFMNAFAAIDEEWLVGVGHDPSSGAIVIIEDKNLYDKEIAP